MCIYIRICVYIPIYIYVCIHIYVENGTMMMDYSLYWEKITLCTGRKFIDTHHILTSPFIMRTHIHTYRYYNRRAYVTHMLLAAMNPTGLCHTIMDFTVVCLPL